jgi:hypothetical protein
MIGCLWNSRSVGKHGMATCIKDMMLDYSLDFIGLQETMKKDYDQSFFRKIDPGINFFWKWVPSVGKSGGILCGVKTESLDVNAVKIGRFMLQFVLWDKIKKM